MKLELDTVIQQMDAKAHRLGELAVRLSKDGTPLEDYDKKLVREVVIDFWEDEFEWQARRYIKTGEQIELPTLGFTL
jgi:hypothetical protein